MSEPNDPVQERSRFLPMLMATLAAGVFCLFMILITGGFFFYVVAAVLGLILLGMFHYAVWGRAMDQEAAAERQRQEMLDKAKDTLDKGKTWTYRR